jgi:hypothetical protein
MDRAVEALECKEHPSAQLLLEVLSARWFLLHITISQPMQRPLSLVLSPLKFSMFKDWYKHDKVSQNGSECGVRIRASG